MREDLPKTQICKVCGADKPIAQVVVVRNRKTGEFLVRPRCKTCHNESEKGHRRKYKKAYLRTWRKRNAEVNESYWRQRNEEQREKINRLTSARFWAKHDAILIQGRLRRRLDMRVTIKEAQELLEKYGCCYPSPQGLTPAGLRECERIRGSMRRLDKKVSNIEIRMMVYEDGYYVKPSRQKRPYWKAACRLRRWQQAKRANAPSRIVRDAA